MIGHNHIYICINIEHNIIDSWAKRLRGPRGDHASGEAVANEQGAVVMSRPMPACTRPFWGAAVRRGGQL